MEVINDFHFLEMIIAAFEPKIHENHDNATEYHALQLVVPDEGHI
jgi:hypothetical protein